MGNKKKYILLQYYSKRNFGDDMFVHVFAKEFSEYNIMLICNPKYIPSNLPSNFIPLAKCWLLSINDHFSSLLKNKIRILNSFSSFLKKRLQRNAKAVVIVMGSMFMERAMEGQVPISFRIGKDIKRNYNIVSKCLNNNGSFVLGANLGPFYDMNYIHKMEKRVRQLNYICFRDYASYMLLKNETNVQYAPDILFNIPTDQVSVNPSFGGKVIISVIDPSKHVNEHHSNTYYELITKAVLRAGIENVILVSFCEREGDSFAIERVLERLPFEFSCKAQKLSYNGDNAQVILEAFKSCDYIISSRFHSMILAAIFGKKFFPISYNCKIENYLNDLFFSGKYAVLSEINEITVDDVFTNLSKDNRELYTTDKHFCYAKNQFVMLHKYLDNLI